MPSTAVDHTGTTGAFKRKVSQHRHRISQTNPDYPPEAGRYHLHVSLACPWANGCYTALHLKGLEGIISYSIVHPTWGETKPNDDSDTHHGFVYRKPGDKPMSSPTGYGSFRCDDRLVIPEYDQTLTSIRDVYRQCGDEVGPFTTPVLYDKQTRTIVNNESTEIMRMLNDEFNHLCANPSINLYPSDKESELQELNNSLIYPTLNNGVYRCGFAKSQSAYNEAVDQLFTTMDILEEKLDKQRYLGGGDHFTWLDLRLFMTLVRFDPVYITYFKTNTKRILDYPNLLGFVRDIYSNENVKKTLSMEHIKTHYFTSHPVLNTYAIIPAYDGPDLEIPHGREALNS